MPMLLSDDLAACRDMLRHGSRSFFAASLLLPRRVRDPAVALYAFCRAADDAVDDGLHPLAAVDDLRDRLDRVYEGRPRNAPVDRAFATVVEMHALPRTLPDHLFEGFAWDAEGRRYERAADLEAYAVRVAGTVGMMMSLLMGRRGEPALARAADLGIAMQYTNIARDVGDDARAGRLYLPTDWVTGAGIVPEVFLARPEPSQALGSVVRRLLELAESHYRLAAGGVALLPPDCRPSIDAARLVYREIGEQVARRGHDSVTARAFVSGRRKAALAARACLAVAFAPEASTLPAPVSARSLARAVAVSPPPVPAGSSTERLIDILTALEQRRRSAASAGYVQTRAAE